MEPLTKRWGTLPAVPTCFNMDFVFNLDEKTFFGLQDIFNRLNEYEAFGLTPKEIGALLEKHGPRAELLS